MGKAAIFKGYLGNLHRQARQGDSREESFYPALKEMLEGKAAGSGLKNIHVTSLPSATDAGNPDFRLWDGSQHIIGYIEAKKPTEENLDRIEQSQQLKRYRETFPNLILTNFLEFRLYRNGERVDTVMLARPVALNTLKTTPPAENPDELHELLDRFLSFSLPRGYNAESLAVELAKRTRFLRDITGRELERETEDSGILSGFFEAFSTFLIGTLTPDLFADLFAQTITYGLFAARMRADDGFNRRTAYGNIPHTIGILRNLFRLVSLEDEMLSEELIWCVDDIANVLAVADAPRILDRYYHEGKGSDPIVHFYETFLAKYDPKERERRGVYYTPEPVVGYIVRSLHGLLKERFGKQDGLASEGITLLDPAAGTMTFVARAAQQAVEEFEEKYGTGGREDFIRNHILKNFYAFELMMAPYAVGHLKMGFFLEELGHRLRDDERMPFYLTNSLDNEDLSQTKFPGFTALAEESHLASEVKNKKPILVILGNPPYSGHSSNTGDWITKLIEDYKQVDGEPLGEKNPKWLQDDYVKFLRFAQWKIDQAGSGVVGMITNHGYLDNPTFRGMRRSLMQTFDEIYVYDLHGNSLKKETCPDGSKDENVFDIRQGVAIVFFVRREASEKASRDAAVSHAALYGLRTEKYASLDASELKATTWERLEPAPPFYVLRPRDTELEASYYCYPSVQDIFPVNSVGIVTSRDDFVIDCDREALKRRIRQFRDASLPDEFIRDAFHLKDKKGWSLQKARKAVRDDECWEERIIPHLYRPFDRRWLFYDPSVIERGREEVMNHMLAGDNLALCIGRQGHVVGPGEWNLAFCSEAVQDLNLFYRGGNVNFPLYLYPNRNNNNSGNPSKSFQSMMLFEPEGEYQDRIPNIDVDICEKLKGIYGEELTPEEIFYYTYAVLYSQSYREKYAEFLEMDFPHVPFTADKELFGEMATLGERLTKLHLLDSPELDPPVCRFEGEGESVVAKTKSKGFDYDPDEQRVYVNKTQYFEPVPEEVWQYQVGGYQVSRKWLKDRKERRLEHGDICTYCQIVTALARTIEIQQKIDELYPGVEEEIVSLESEEKT